ncbi:PEP-CTERM sorting domain-containing protein [Roseateles sp. DXS20W]|uniref:PEP-CTERM sorting domain-containing protein n=1 Tax=Pelomonas lactea TaxID=3299030 RepID=A0ABW7GNG2_9BURK
MFRSTWRRRALQLLTAATTAWAALGAPAAQGASSFRSGASCKANAPFTLAVECARVAASSDEGLLPNQVLSTGIDPPSSFDYKASASARSGPGNLGLAIAASLSGGLNGFPGVLGSQASATVAYADTVRITSATLAPGTPIQLTVSQTLSFTMLTSGSAAGRLFGIVTGLGVSGVDGFYLRYCRGNAYSDCIPVTSDKLDQTVTLSGVVSTQVGGSVTLSGSLDALTLVLAHRGVASAGYVASAASISSLNSAHTFIESQTPGVTLLADSGHNYAALAVPEPAPLALLLAGLGVLAVRARARRLSAP